MKTIFKIRWDRGNKYLSLKNYKKSWKICGMSRMWCIRTNGARKENGDSCFDLHIHLGYLILNYTDYAYNKVI